MHPILTTLAEAATLTVGVIVIYGLAVVLWAAGP